MRLSEIASLSAEHLWLVAIAVWVAMLIAAPTAVLLTRHVRLRRATLAVVNVVQTIPSLALFGFLLPFLGVGKVTAVLALVLYALLPLLRNTVVGILGVDGGVLESAVAMGMTRRQILWKVELPLPARWTRQLGLDRGRGF